MSELPGMAQMPIDSNKIPNIPTAQPVNQMPAYGSPMMPAMNPQDTGSNNDPMAANKAPSLQSNMFKMQRNKSE